MIDQGTIRAMIRRYASGGGVSDGDKGDITVSGSGGTWTIDNDVVTYAKMQNAASAGFIGATGSGDYSHRTPAEVTAALDTFTSSLKGLAPASGGGTTNFLRADGAWAALFSRSAVVATTSVTAIDFTGIPTTAVAIDLHLIGVSLSGTDRLLVQLLNAGGSPITAGYLSTSGTVGSTAGMIIAAAAATDVVSGTLSLRRGTGTRTWASSHAVKRTSALTLSGGGDIAATADVTGIRLTRSGTNTFDAGSAFVEWRS